MSEGFIVTDKVKILPNKGYGVITKISVSGFIFLDHKNYRPYLPTQIEKVKDIPKITPVKKPKKQNSFWRRFWFERPNTLADEESATDFFIGMMFGLGIMITFWSIVFGIVFLILSI